MLAQDTIIKNGMVRTKDSIMECPHCKSTFQKDHVRTRMRKWGKDSFYSTKHCPNCDKRILLRDDNPDIESVNTRLSKLRTYCNYCKMNGQFDEYRDAMGETLELQKQIEDMRNGEMKSKVKDFKTLGGTVYISKGGDFRVKERDNGRGGFEYNVENTVGDGYGGPFGSLSYAKEYCDKMDVKYSSKDSKKHMKDAASVALKKLGQVKKQVKDAKNFMGERTLLEDWKSYCKNKGWVIKENKANNSWTAYYSNNQEAGTFFPESGGWTHDSKTKDDYKRMSLAELQKKAKEGYFELQSDPKPRNHVEIKYPDGKKEWVFVEDSKKTKDAPSPKDTYNQLRGMSKIALQGYARRVGYPELSDFQRMDEEGIRSELISYLHGYEGDKFLENPNNFRDSKPTAKDKLLKGLDSLKRRVKDAFGMNIEEKQKEFDVRDIEKETVENNAFRKVVFTGNTLQLVLMSLLPNEDIGMEVHDNVDQFFRVEEGEGLLEVKDQGTYPLKAGSSMLIKAGTAHNVINNGSEPLKIYTLYGPPNHPADRLQNTKAEALKEEEKKVFGGDKKTKDINYKSKLMELKGRLLEQKKGGASTIEIRNTLEEIKEVESIIRNNPSFDSKKTKDKISVYKYKGFTYEYDNENSNKVSFIKTPSGKVIKEYAPNAMPTITGVNGKIDAYIKQVAHDKKTKDASPADKIKDLLQNGYSLKDAILKTEKSIGRQLNAFEAAEAVAVSKKMGKTKDEEEGLYYYKQWQVYGKDGKWTATRRFLGKTGSPGRGEVKITAKSFEEAKSKIDDYIRQVGHDKKTKDKIFTVSAVIKSQNQKKRVTKPVNADSPENAKKSFESFLKNIDPSTEIIEMTTDKKTKDEGKYKIYWINHNYYSQEEFNTLEEARKYADSKSFEYRIDLNGKPVASGGTLRGFRRMDKKTKDEDSKTKDADPETIERRYKQLKGKSKEELLQIYQSQNRLDMSHVKSEPRDSIINAIINNEYNRKDIEKWASNY